MLIPGNVHLMMNDYALYDEQRRMLNPCQRNKRSWRMTVAGWWPTSPGVGQPEASTAGPSRNVVVDLNHAAHRVKRLGDGGAAVVHWPPVQSLRSANSNDSRYTHWATMAIRVQSVMGLEALSSQPMGTAWWGNWPTSFYQLLPWSTSVLVWLDVGIVNTSAYGIH